MLTDWTVYRTIIVKLLAAQLNGHTYWEKRIKWTEQEERVLEACAAESKYADPLILD